VAEASRRDGGGVDQDRLRRPDRQGERMRGSRPELGEVPGRHVVRRCNGNRDRIEAKSEAVERRRKALADCLQISLLKCPEPVEGRGPFCRFLLGDKLGLGWCEITCGKLGAGRRQASASMPSSWASDSAGGEAARVAQAEMKVGLRLGSVERRFSVLGGPEAQICGGDTCHAA
jgi:hypothetical protein